MKRAAGRVQGAGVGLERGLLGLVLGCAVVLVGIGLGPLGDAERAGREARERLVARVIEDVRGEWRRMAGDGELERQVAGELVWPVGLEFEAGRLTGRELRAEDPAGADDFALLFAAVRWRERRPEQLDEARGLLRGALELSGLSTEQRALGRLRALQLALRAGEREAALEAWQLAREEIGGEWTSAGQPAAALAGFAAAPVLSAEERAELRLRLERDWAAGELALPPGDPRALAGETALRIELPAAWTALLERSQALAPQVEASPALAQRLLSERVATLAWLVGELPRPAEIPETGWVRASPIGTLAILSGPAGHLRAGRIDTAACAVVLAARLRAAGLLPPGMALDFGAQEELGAAVAQRIPLWADVLGCTLRHPAPERLAGAERRRASVLRYALLLVALVATASGALGFRALRRERKLRELRSTFVAGVSHELRTPLSSILLMAENLESGRVHDETTRARYFGLLRREAQRLGRLVDGVLDVSRLERGRGPELRLEELELRAFVAELTGELRAEARERGGELILELGELPERAVLDAHALRRALWNLVDNALKHGGGAARLAVGAKAGLLLFELSDRGPGIPAAHRARLFEPFERLGAGDAAPGTGLGLSIAREIARAHGGELAARAPDEGPGVLFSLSLPLGAEEGAARGVA